MGYRLLTGKSPRYFTRPPRPTQPPTLSMTGNEYGDAVLLGSVGRMAHSIRYVNKRGWQVKLYDPSLTRAYPIALDTSMAHIKKGYINVMFTSSTIHCKSIKTSHCNIGLQSF